MENNLIDTAIELISFLIANTSWGKKTSCEEMLKLLYEECRELELSLNSADFSSIVEEASDVNMMLAYFFCKLPESNLHDIKSLFKDVANNKNYVSRSNRELYRDLLINYSRLTDLFEGTYKVSALNKCAETIILCTFSLVNNNSRLSNNTPSIDMIFSAVIEKLRRRYPSYFKHTSTSINTNLEEQNWIFGKKIEKDMLYSYCDNPCCEFFKKIGKKNLEIADGHLRCIICRKNISLNSLLLPEQTFKDRRAILENLESHLIRFGQGDLLTPSLYAYYNVDDYIVIISYLLSGNISPSEFTRFFSNKCFVPSETIRDFLRICFCYAFSPEYPNKKPIGCAKKILTYIYNFPETLIDLLKYLRIEGDILLCPLERFSSKYSVSSSWQTDSNQTWEIDLKGKKSIITILLTINNLVASEQVTKIVLKNISNCVCICKFKQIIDYIFINNKYGINCVEIIPIVQPKIKV